MTGLETSLIGALKVKLLLLLLIPRRPRWYLISVPWATRFSSRSAHWPPHDGLRRARRPNLSYDLRFWTLNDIALPIVPTGTIPSAGADFLMYLGLSPYNDPH